MQCWGVAAYAVLITVKAGREGVMMVAGNFCKGEAAIGSARRTPSLSLT